MPNFSGIWTVTQQMQAKGASTWPATPGAPTIGTASNAGTTSISVAFTAPACTGYPAGITGYLATSTPGCFTATGASSPLVVTGLTTGTPYTFKVKATNSIGYGPCSAASNSATPAALVGQQAYTSAGSYSWVAPSGITSVSVVAVGGGGGGSASYGAGAGGALGYKNNYTVIPGNSYTVFVGNGCSGSVSGTASYFVNTCTLRAGGGGRAQAPGSGIGGTYTGDGGGNGGPSFSGQGGGAGGYSGNGGSGGGGPGGSGAAGAGGGGGGGGFTACGCGIFRANGGGVGILGEGTSGAGGTNNGTYAQAQGKGGSGGANGCTNGGAYGGGGGYRDTPPSDRSGAGGAVRIIWPGTSRSFPSTCTGNL
jgi:hypothetical protein